MKKTTWIFLCIFLALATAAFAQRVQETDDIDSFINEDKPTSTSTTTAAPATAAAPSQTADSVIPHKIFSLGIGLNLGFYIGNDIDDINNHIKNEFNIGTTYEISFGEAEMYLNFVPRFTINIMPVRYLLIQLMGEVAWGPKVVTTVYDSKTYHYLRYSPGLVLNAYLPLGKRKKYSLFIGGGAFYHFFEFESYSADAFGGRGQFGLRIDWNSTALEVFLAYDYARGETGQYNPYLNKEMVLDYSSILLGVNLYFKIL